MVTLIFNQGIFFQPWTVLDHIELREGKGIGGFDTADTHLNQYMYSGAIWVDDKSLFRDFVGVMEDHFGVADLRDFVILESVVSFIKRYRDKNKGAEGDIKYQFNIREGPIWFGEYSGQDCGSGVTRCLITDFELQNSFR